jgi:hypothetical protein
MREYTIILRVRCDMSVDALRKLVLWETSRIDEVVQADVIDFAPNPVGEQT